MAQTRIIIDTNAYLRLGKSISPLLGIPFGKENLTVYAHDYLEIELIRKSRLKSKFFWIDDVNCVSERKKRIPKTKEQKTNIDLIYDYIYDYQKQNNFNLSLEDKYCLATAMELNITCVTDEKAMREVSNEYAINTITTLGLLKLMVDNNFINVYKVRQIIGYLESINDLPYKIEEIKKEFILLFGENLSLDNSKNP